MISGGFDGVDPPMPCQDFAERVGKRQRPEAKRSLQSIERLIKELPALRLRAVDERPFEHKQRFVEAVGIDPRLEVAVGPAAGKHALHAAMSIRRESLPDDVKIADAASDWPDVIEVQRQRGDAVHRQFAEAWFEARDAAISRGANDRAAGLGAERRHAHFRRDRGRAAAGRAARRMFEIPGIACWRGIETGPLGRDRLAQEDRPCLLERRDDRRVAVGNVPCAQGRATLGRPAGDIDDVLDTDRDAVQRAEPFVFLLELFQTLSLAPSAVGIDEDPSPDFPFELVDPLQAVLDQIDGPEQPFAHVMGRLGDARKFGHHHA